MRVSNTIRGTVEVLLDAIRVDESATIGDGGELRVPRSADAAPRADASNLPDLVNPQPAETFPTMTGQ